MSVEIVGYRPPIITDRLINFLRAEGVRPILPGIIMLGAAVSLASEDGAPSEVDLDALYPRLMELFPEKRIDIGFHIHTALESAWNARGAFAHACAEQSGADRCPGNSESIALLARRFVDYRERMKDEPTTVDPEVQKYLGRIDAARYNRLYRPTPILRPFDELERRRDELELEYIREHADEWTEELNRRNIRVPRGFVPACPPGEEHEKFAEDAARLDELERKMELESMLLLELLELTDDEDERPE